MVNSTAETISYYTLDQAREIIEAEERHNIIMAEIYRKRQAKKKREKMKLMAVQKIMGVCSIMIAFSLVFLNEGMGAIVIFAFGLYMIFTKSLLIYRG